MKNDFSKPILKVGQLWRNGEGDKVRIESNHEALRYYFRGDNGHTYTVYGGFYVTRRDKRDLVELIEGENSNPVSATPNPENYKRIDHKDGRIEFVPIEGKKDEYFDFGEKFNLNEDSHPLFTGNFYATKGFKHKELLVYEDYQVEVIEQGGYTRLRFKKK